MTIVEYILEPQDKPRSFHPQTVTSYITDGGYWINPDGEKMIGVGLEGSFPDSVTKFTLEGLQARQRAIHAEYPMVKFLSQYGYAPRYLSDKGHEINEAADQMTDDEVDAAIKEWVDVRS